MGSFDQKQLKKVDDPENPELYERVRSGAITQNRYYNALRILSKRSKKMDPGGFEWGIGYICNKDILYPN